MACRALQAIPHPLLPFISLPVLFDRSLSSGLAALRKFRQVPHHGYGFQSDGEQMAEGIANVNGIDLRLKKGIDGYASTWVGKHLRKNAQGKA